MSAIARARQEMKRCNACFGSFPKRALRLSGWTRGSSVFLLCITNGSGHKIRFSFLFLDCLLYSRTHSFSGFLFCNTDALARYAFTLANAFKRENKYLISPIIIIRLCLFLQLPAGYLFPARTHMDWNQSGGRIPENLRVDLGHS